MFAPKLFYHDKELVFRSMTTHFPVIAEMAERFKTLTKRHPPKVAFYQAFNQTHGDKDGFALSTGAEEFCRQLPDYLRMATREVQVVIDEYLWPKHQSLAMHNAISNCMNPLRLMLYAMDRPSAGASHIDVHRCFEAYRQLSIALQFFLIDLVDPELSVSDDLEAIDTLSWKRLFVGHESPKFWVLTELHPDTSVKLPVQSVSLFLTHEAAWKHAEFLKQCRLSFQEKVLICRTAHVGDQKYFVHAVDRKKWLFPTLLKLERGRKMNDRRGWMYVVVAIDEPNTGLRVATEEDTERFFEHTQEVLWQDPLIKQAELHDVNPDSDRDYSHREIRGRYQNIHADRIVMGAAEQLTLNLKDYLNAQFTRSALNHETYRAQCVWKYLAPLWFPTDSKLFFPTLPELPLYDNDWGSEAVRSDLERWWNHRLSY